MYVRNYINHVLDEADTVKIAGYSADDNAPQARRLFRTYQQINQKKDEIQDLKVQRERIQDRMKREREREKRRKEAERDRLQNRTQEED